jgi:glycine hydroxymethyltransferase
MSIQELIEKETQRQRETLMMIPSENYTYPEVRAAVGSVLMHKYSEGYIGKRYYQGNEIIDDIEAIAIENAKKLFKVPHANVQPYSGSPANSAVLMGLLQPGDTVMGMNLSSGGHLTHGHPNITFSGRFFKSVQFGLSPEGNFDYEEISRIISSEKPKLLILGTTAYPRILDFEKFAQIASETILVADISHIAGLVVAGVHPNPAKYFDVITTTTHKILRGPRGAMIMVTENGLKKDPDMAKKIDRAVFPGLQGGPHDNTTAGIAIALEKAATPEYSQYAKQVVLNGHTLAEKLKEFEFNLVTGGTDNHLLLVDLRNKNVSGKDAAVALEKAGIVVNANAVPFDDKGPLNPSGIRLGTPAVTSRGMQSIEMEKIAEWISEVVQNVSNDNKLEETKTKVVDLCAQFPLDF